MPTNNKTNKQSDLKLYQSNLTRYWLTAIYGPLNELLLLFVLILLFGCNFFFIRRHLKFLYKVPSTKSIHTSTLVMSSTMKHIHAA